MKRVVRTDVTKGKKVQMGRGSSSYALAEMSYLRGDFEDAYLALNKQVHKGARDFASLNLLGCCLAQMGRFPEAEQQMQKLITGTKSRLHLEKASFNLGLVHLYQDLKKTGDISVSQTAFSTHISSTFLMAPGVVPFERPIQTWKKIYRKNASNANIISTYLSFAFLLHGDIGEALDCAVSALSKSDGFFVTHYVVGKIFLDLFLLALEGNEFPLLESHCKFFEIEPSEILKKDGQLCHVLKDTLLEISLQALHNARELAQYSAEVLLCLTQAYTFAGLHEEAHVTLMQAEAVSPESLAVLDSILRFHERMLNPPEIIALIVKKIKKIVQSGSSKNTRYLLPPYFLI